MNATAVLLDTSVVIALARGEPLRLPDPLPDATISAVTLCGLHRGVLAARDDQRAARLAVLAYAERTFAALAMTRGSHLTMRASQTRRQDPARTSAGSSPTC